MKLVYIQPKRLYYELLTIKETKDHRKINCIFYDLCLNHAIHLGWDSFSCKSCEMYIEDETIETDYNNVLDLFKAIVDEYNKVPVRYVLKKRSERNEKNEQ